MSIITTLKISIFTSFFIFTSNLKAAPLTTVDYVDVQRYLGNWYEIASIPQIFQKGCTNSRAQYSETDSANKIKVKNSCTRNGEVTSVTGKATIEDEETNAKLKVQFFWPFKGDYWIIELDPEYQYAVVGEPKRENLWILSRSKKMDPELYQSLMNKIRDVHGYDLSLIKKSVQN